MRKNILNRQNVFNTIWKYYIVEGRPFSVKDEDETGNLKLAFKTSTGKSPLAIINKAKLDKNVTDPFLMEMQLVHTYAVRDTFDTVNIKRVRDFYARSHRRVFRKIVKEYLKNFALNYNLQIPYDRAVTISELKLAAKNKT